MSQPSQTPSQQPISFKTVPGRNRTQKWTQAKTNNYDGDDWGGYDDYDDYGGYSEPSNTQQNSGPQLQRQSSFDRGVDTERRQFSSGTAIYEPERHTSPSGSGQTTNQDGRSPEDTRRRMREFSNPGQVPQPLNTPRSPVTPGSVDRPPRKSSLGGSPAPGVRAMPATTSPSLDKPLPFVRPSDIYKRMEEERQKERPSMDALHREMGSPSLGQHTLHRKKSQESLPSNSGRRPSLEPVNEAREPKPTSPDLSLPSVAEQSAPAMTIAQPSIQPTDTSDQNPLRPSDSSPRLPPVTRLSGFGSFLPRDEEEERLSATGLAASTAAANAAASALSSGSRDVTPTMPAHRFSNTHDQPTHGNDPAAEIAAERSTRAPVEQLGRSADEHPGGLSHQPSAGFRSVVHKAFDNQGDGSVPASPISHDFTHGLVTRSDTNSTRSISPIMSRVPSVATAQQKQQEREAVVPSIAEETPLEVAKSRPSHDSTAPQITSRSSVLRKPTPNHSRNVSSEIPGFTPGYRRSMDTPSPNNSPARTPGLGDTDTRRLSGPMSAVTVNDPEGPDVDPSAPEMPSATLEQVETPLETLGSTFSGASEPEYVKPLPTTGRGRSGTDYSVRESDLALEAKVSPENSPSVAEAATIQQNLFLDTHPSNPSSPVVLSPTGFARPFPHPATSGSGRSSPAGTSRSRVRNMVDQFHQIDVDSKRNSVASATSSKSSWSNFGGEEEVVPGLNRRTTGGSALSQQTPGDSAMFPAYDQADLNTSTVRAATSPTRPAAERLDSFKPHLPGEWISAAPTPASEVPEPALDVERGRDQTNRDITPVAPPTPKGASLASPDEEVDLTPTTRKTKLHGRDPSVGVDESQSALAAAKNAGDALGTAFMSSAGYGHQTRDFANQGSAAPVDVPELRPHRQTGNIEHLNLPILRRGDSDAPSDGTNSVANSVPPTPPAKDTPQPPGLAANAGPGVGRPVSNYFAGVTPDAVAPLSFGKQSPNASRDFAPTRPAVLPTLSTDTRATDFESDRLRKDIYRSLGEDKMAEAKRESPLDDADRTQDALDAPDNERRIASGQSALPPAEAKSSDARSGLPSQARPGLLGQRFSWENRSTDGSDRLYAPMAVVGEAKGDEGRESYERPRSNQGLHVVNTQVVADSEPSTADTDKQEEPHFMLNEAADAEKRLSTGLPIGTAALALGSHGNDASKDAVSPVAESPENSSDGLDNLAPTPMVEDVDEAARTAEPLSPVVPSKEGSPSLPSPSKATAKPSTAAHSKLPSFRDLAAIKNTDDRIAAYETTRRRFADMNTGISGWLSGMVAAHPEYANAGSQKYEGPAVIQTAGLSNTISGLGGTIGGTIRGASHKHSPSILKIGGERKASTTSTSGTTPTTASTSTHQDVEKMQAKGKDFMKSAGAGAKGLFAKGKSRFGRSGEKGSSSSVSSPLVIAPAFAVAVDTSSNKNLPSSAASQPASAPTNTNTTTEKATEPATAKLPSRPIAPSALQTVSADVNETDPVSATATAERPRSVFGRLRDVSRSNTRSRSRSNSIVFGAGYGDKTTTATEQRKSPGPSRSVSRAASLVFGRGGGETDQAPLPAPMPAPALEKPATTPAPILTSIATSASPLVMPGPEDRRREAWEDDDAEVGDASGWRDEHGRLGVLPSPSVQESVGPASPGKPRQGSWIGEIVEQAVMEEEVEGWKLPPAEHGMGLAGPFNKETSDVDLKQQDESLVPTAVPAPNIEETPSASGQDARRSSLDNVKVRRPSVKHAQSRSASSAFPASTASRPQPERKFSALDQLPSQQRRRQFTPVATPRRMSLADDAAPPRVTDTLPSFAPLQTDPSRTQGNSDFLADVRPSPTKSSRPATPANWDKLSAVSSPKAVDDTASRRSSVSSLGNPQSPDTIVIPGAASKRQSIVGMPTSTLDSMLDENQPRSVSPLHFGGNGGGSRTPTGVEQRPMSYLPHSRRSSGVMAQDSIDVTQAGKRYSTASGMADYPVPGAFPYPQQQQPSQPPSRAPSIKQAPKEYDKLRSPQAGDQNPAVGESSSKHSSGFFRGPDVSAAGGPGAIPSPSKLDANYDGLIDTQVDQIADEIARAEQPQKRRKSGIMDSFRRASTYSNANASRPSSPAKGNAGNVSANESSLAKTKTLKKPQRASSSAVEPPKNKRFSGLGSLFRRSSTMTPRTSAPAGSQASTSQAASPVATPKASKKLTKTQPPQPQQQYSQQLTNYYAGPPPGNYAAYEAMTRQQGHSGQGQQMPPQYWQQQQPQQVYADPAMVSSPFQPQVAATAGPQRQSGYYQQVPSQAQYQQYPPQGTSQQHQTSVPNSRTHSLVSSPVSEQAAPFEHYGSPQGQPAQPMPQPRRLHSEGHWRRDTVPGIPEANSPVNSSKEFSAAPVRSYTDGHGESAHAQGSLGQQAQHFPSRPTIDTRQPSTYSQSSVVRSPAVAQIPDNFPQAPGRQDYQTQYWQPQHRPQREPTLPQLQTQAPPAGVPNTSVGSIDQQMARSPAKDYQDQQTPWSISLPQDGSNRQSSGSSRTQQPQNTQPQQQYRGPPAAARGAVRNTQPPPQRQQDQYSSMTQAQNMASQGQQRASHYGEQVSSPTTYSTQPSNQAPYSPGSPLSPQGYEYASANQYHHGYAQPQHTQQQPRQPHQQNRYYSQAQGASRSVGLGPQRQFSQNDQGRPLSYQRTASGYSGRRDDAGVSESEIMNMRGASYPGQEWVPGRG